MRDIKDKHALNIKKVFVNYLTICMLVSVSLCISESLEAQNRRRSGLSQLEFDDVKDATPTPIPRSRDPIGQLIKDVAKKPGASNQQGTSERKRMRRSSGNSAPAKREFYDPRNPQP